MLNYLLIFSSALLLSLILNALFRSLALKIKFVTSQGVTYSGGLSMWLTFAVIWISSGILWPLYKAVWGLILGSGLIVAFGIIDDYKKELSVAIKFLVQIVATIMLILSGIKTQIVHIGPYLNILITFLWVLGITNAFNLLDILDGLAGGVAVISALTFYLIALSNANPPIGIISLILVAITLGFLRYNFSSAKVYMGNSGSHFLGFVLAAIAIAISYAPLERKIALFSPILVLGLPIFDTLFLIFMRAKKKKPIFRKSNDHLVLRLLEKGYSKKKALIFMYLLGLFFSLSGLIISRVSNWIGIIVLFVVVLICLTLGKKISQYLDK